MPTATMEQRKTISLAAMVNAAFTTDDAAPPCFNWTACGQPAGVEKAGRSLCRRCAAVLNGIEYPLRNPSTESLYASDRLAAEALDMVEEQHEADRGAPRLAEESNPDDPQFP